MPRLDVRSPREARFAYFDSRPPHSVLYTPSLRIMASLLIGPDPVGKAPDTRPPVLAILDTGAAISIFPHSVWGDFPRGVYEILNPAELPAGRVHPRGQLLAQEYTYDFARLSVAVADGAGRRLRSVPVIAQFMHEGYRLSHPLVGLSESVLSNRVLRRQYASDAPFE